MKSSSSLKHSAKQHSLQVRTYLATLPADTRRHVQKLREAIRAAAPGAVESFGYGMPAFSDLPSSSPGVVPLDSIFAHAVNCLPHLPAIVP
jgi:hypothetical protein